MYRFAANPRWLVYLPPTMSPSETSQVDGHLEYPTEAFSYFRKHDVQSVVCEEKHMGSRAVVVLCQNEKTALSRFSVSNEGAGIVYTRTGRRFFDDANMEQQVLAIVGAAFDRAGLWKQLASDWVIVESELIPLFSVGKNPFIPASNEGSTDRHGGGPPNSGQLCHSSMSASDSCGLRGTSLLALAAALRICQYSHRPGVCSLATARRRTKDSGCFRNDRR